MTLENTFIPLLYIKATQSIKIILAALNVVMSLVNMNAKTKLT